MQSATSPTTAAPEPPRDSALSVHVGISVLLGVVLTLVWGVTSAGYFWPAWVWLALAIPVGIHVAAKLSLRRPPGRDRGMTLATGLVVTQVAILIVVWLLSGAHGFWPAFPIAALALAFGIVALVAYRDRLPGLGGRQELVERVDVLERTRDGALNVQAAELRRIERDLHDGAQARLVALSMLLGRAEERLADRPEEAELVRQARTEAGNAIAELRDLARGIAPPVLADRGLAAAVEALGRRSAISVTVDAQLTGARPIPVVETAAYFVVAEALTNAAKHGAGASARVRLAQEDERLIVEVVDDGPGGADPEGAGLTGLRHRVEALDGRLSVASTAGLGTLVRAELPCGS
jgi:signal transduction histidine kinase